MRVIVCGGRDFNDGERVSSSLSALHAETPITELIQGGARGADRLARNWAEKRDIKSTEVPAQWSVYRRAAGWHRNSAMADLKPDAVIAFPGGVGTEMMKRIARGRGIKVIEL